MLRTITIICCFSLSLNVLFSQQNNTIQNKLLEIELSIFNEVDSSLKAELILEKINLLSANNLDFSAIINEYERIDFEFLNDSLKAKFFWNAALIYYFNDDIYTSIYYQKKNEELRFVQIDSTKNYLLKFILYSKYNLEIALKHLNELIQIDSNFQCIECLTTLYNDEKIKGEKFYKYSSLILPGIYSFHNKEYLKGITSLSLNVATFLVIRNLYMQQLYFNLFTWGGNLLSKFYIGNRTLLSKQMNENKIKHKKKRTENCTLELNSILEKYTLDLFIF